MLSLRLSQAAINKIASDADLLAEVRGRDLRWVLMRYTACFSTDKDGRRIDYGGGLGLHFVDKSEPMEEGAMQLAADGGLCVSVLLFGEPSDGCWIVDYQDRAFSLVEAS